LRMTVSDGGQVVANEKSQSYKNQAQLE
jgi:hypothetical protein